MKVDFFIVGAPKSATTSLFNYLSQHEGISMSSIKEPDFFSHLELNKQKLYYERQIEKIDKNLEHTTNVINGKILNLNINRLAENNILKFY